MTYETVTVNYCILSSDCFSCSEAVVMLANIKQHAAYIATTVGYIGDQIAADSSIVTDAPVSHQIHFSLTMLGSFEFHRPFVSVRFSVLSPVSLEPLSKHFPSHCSFLLLCVQQRAVTQYCGVRVQQRACRYEERRQLDLQKEKRAQCKNGPPLSPIHQHYVLVHGSPCAATSSALIPALGCSSPIPKHIALSQWDQLRRGLSPENKSVYYYDDDDYYYCNSFLFIFMYLR